MEGSIDYLTDDSAKNDNESKGDVPVLEKLDVTGKEYREGHQKIKGIEISIGACMERNDEILATIIGLLKKPLLKPYSAYYLFPYQN